MIMQGRLIKLKHSRRAFTLLEILIVIGMVSALTALIVPAMSSAREQANTIVCRSNLNQIMLANRYYAEANGGRYVPGAADFRRNLNRWHGGRARKGVAFDSSNGPLADYLGDSQGIRTCPSFPAEQIAEESGGFETGNGGYGYNNAYIGVIGGEQAGGAFGIKTDRSGVVVDWVAQPVSTIMFADTAFASNSLIEYSFAEPRFHPKYPAYRADPSLHFRHAKTANIGWVDGHVDSQRLVFSASSGYYPLDPASVDIGWSGQADDNSLFDLK